MNAKDIVAKRFKKVTSGYRPEEVDEYLKDVAIAYANAVKEKEESEAKIIKLVEKINEYRNDEDAIRDALLVASKEGNRIISEARAESDRIISEAQAKRDELLADITNDCEVLKRSEVEKIAAAIQEENDKLNAVVAASKTQTELQTEKLEKLKAEVTDFKKKLILILNEQIRVVNELPELSDEEISKIVSGQIKPVQPEKQEPAPQEQKSVAAAAQSSEPAVPKKRTDFGGFDESKFKKQEFSSEELKFGQNLHTKK